MEPTALPYRTVLAQQGKAVVQMYSGDPGVSANVLRLVEAAGGGTIESGNPNTVIPGRSLEQPATQTIPNTVAVDPATTSAASTSTTATTTKLSLQGVTQWVKDNPGKAIAVGVGVYLVLNELLKKKRK